MTDAPVATTFDIGELFAGKAYPKDSVDVYLDEEVAYELSQTTREIAKALNANNTDELKVLEARSAELVKRGAASKVTIHLTGVSRGDRKHVLDEILEQFPQQYDFLGRALPNPEADDAHANARWALHIERIERPDGSNLVAPKPEEIALFRAKAPDSAIEDIELKIRGFSEGAKNGFETLAQEQGFLSQP